MNKLAYYIFIFACLIIGSGIFVISISSLLNERKIEFITEEGSIEGKKFVNYYLAASNFKIFEVLNSNKITIENANGKIEIEASKFVTTENNFEIRTSDAKYYIPTNCNFLKFKTKFTEQKNININEIIESVTCVEDYKSQVENIYPTN